MRSLKCQTNLVSQSDRQTVDRQTVDRQIVVRQSLLKVQPKTKGLVPFGL